MRYRIILPGALLLLAVDRVLKMLALRGVSLDIGILRFSLFENDGLIFSIPLPVAAALVLMSVAITVVAALGIRAWRAGQERAMLGCGFILLGAVSNLYDRIAYGFVVDWASFGNWSPVFNVADLGIAAGVFLLLWPRTVDKQAVTE